MIKPISYGALQTSAISSYKIILATLAVRSSNLTSAFCADVAIDLFKPVDD